MEEYIKNYRKMENLVKDINAGKCGDKIKFRGIVLEKQVVYWNDINCYVDLENEDNYINLDRAGKVSRFCINEIYKDF